MRIDGLNLPLDVTITAEKLNFDTTRRTVSGRLVTKLSPAEKWKITVSFENITLALPLQMSFYEKCAAMRNRAAIVEFTNPYTGATERAIMKCVSKVCPVPGQIVRRNINLYRNIGAVFEEV